MRAFQKVRAVITKKLQKLFWIYLTKNFVITSLNDVRVVETTDNWAFVPIRFDNYFRVADFRSKDRISEYRQKLDHGEIGFFAQLGDKMVGSIWATINRERRQAVARSHIRLMPNEALVHDIVTGEEFRGMGVGPFMVGGIASALLAKFEVSRIIIDVNVKNTPSLRMMAKTGLCAREKVLAISALGTVAWERVLKNYA